MSTSTLFFTPLTFGWRSIQTIYTATKSIALLFLVVSSWFDKDRGISRAGPALDRIVKILKVLGQDWSGRTCRVEFNYTYWQ